MPPSWWEVSPFHFHWYSLDVTHTRNSHTWKGLPEPRQKRIPLLSLGVWEKQPPLVKAAGTGVLREGDLPLRSGAVIPRGWGSPHQLFFLHLPTSCPQVWLHEWEVHNTVEWLRSRSLTRWPKRGGEQLESARQSAGSAEFRKFYKGVYELASELWYMDLALNSTDYENWPPPGIRLATGHPNTAKTLKIKLI